MLKNLEVEKMRHLPMPKSFKEQLLLSKKEAKQRKKQERRNNHKEKLGAYRLFLIKKNNTYKVFRQDEFPGNKVPANIREIGIEI